MIFSNNQIALTSRKGTKTTKNIPESGIQKHTHAKNTNQNCNIKEEEQRV
jgi:hypothetical protein